jgi:KUP system potassium uptake protein
MDSNYRRFLNSPSNLNQISCCLHLAGNRDGGEEEVINVNQELNSCCL